MLANNISAFEIWDQFSTTLSLFKIKIRIKLKQTPKNASRPNFKLPKYGTYGLDAFYLFTSLGILDYFLALTAVPIHAISISVYSNCFCKLFI